MSSVDHDMRMVECETTKNRQGASLMSWIMMFVLIWMSKCFLHRQSMPIRRDIERSPLVIRSSFTHSEDEITMTRVFHWLSMSILSRQSVSNQCVSFAPLLGVRNSEKRVDHQYVVCLGSFMSDESKDRRPTGQMDRPDDDQLIQRASGEKPEQQKHRGKGRVAHL